VSFLAKFTLSQATRNYDPVLQARYPLADAHLEGLGLPPAAFHDQDYGHQVMGIPLAPAFTYTAPVFDDPATWGFPMPAYVGPAPVSAWPVGFSQASLPAFPSNNLYPIDDAWHWDPSHSSGLPSHPEAQSSHLQFDSFSQDTSMMPPPLPASAKKTASGRKKVQSGRKTKSAAGPSNSKVFSESPLADLKGSCGGRSFQL
jgi:hypothetical protein